MVEQTILFKQVFKYPIEVVPGGVTTTRSPHGLVGISNRYGLLFYPKQPGTFACVDLVETRKTGKLHETLIPLSLSAENVKGFLVDEVENVLWVVTEHHVYQYAEFRLDERPTVYVMADEIEDFCIYDESLMILTAKNELVNLYKDVIRKNVLSIASSHGKLGFITTDGKVHVEGVDVIEDATMENIHGMIEGGFLLESKDAVFHLNDGKLVQVEIPKLSLKPSKDAAERIFVNIPDWDDISNMVLFSERDGLKLGLLLSREDGELRDAMSSISENYSSDIPICKKLVEGFPVGLALDFGDRQATLVDEIELPPAPLVWMLLSNGHLCAFLLQRLDRPESSYKRIPCEREKLSISQDKLDDLLNEQIEPVDIRDDLSSVEPDVKETTDDDTKETIDETEKLEPDNRDDVIEPYEATRNTFEVKDADEVNKDFKDHIEEVKEAVSNDVIEVIVERKEEEEIILKEIEEIPPVVEGELKGDFKLESSDEIDLEKDDIEFHEDLERLCMVNCEPIEKTQSEARVGEVPLEALLVEPEAIAIAPLELPKLHVRPVEEQAILMNSIRRLDALMQSVNASLAAAPLPPMRQYNLEAPMRRLEQSLARIPRDIQSLRTVSPLLESVRRDVRDAEGLLDRLSIGDTAVRYRNMGAIQGDIKGTLDSVSRAIRSDSWNVDDLAEQLKTSLASLESLKYTGTSRSAGERQYVERTFVSKRSLIKSLDARKVKITAVPIRNQLAFKPTATTLTRPKEPAVVIPVVPEKPAVKAKPIQVIPTRDIEPPKITDPVPPVKPVPTNEPVRPVHTNVPVKLVSNKPAVKTEKPEEKKESPSTFSLSSMNISLDEPVNITAPPPPSVSVSSHRPVPAVPIATAPSVPKAAPFITAAPSMSTSTPMPPVVPSMPPVAPSIQPAQPFQWPTQPQPQPAAVQQPSFIQQPNQFNMHDQHASLQFGHSSQLGSSLPAAVAVPPTAGFAGFATQASSSGFGLSTPQQQAPPAPNPPKNLPSSFTSFRG